MNLCDIHSSNYCFSLNIDQSYSPNR